MTLVMNSKMNGTSSQQVSEAQESDKTSAVELKLIKSRSIKDASSMPDHLKKRVRENAPSITELFEDVVKQKGELTKLEKVDENTFRIDDISSLTLQAFAIKAQEYGKDVTYKKETIITIS